MLKKDISIVKHALLDGMSSKAVWDSFERIKKYLKESSKTPDNTERDVICSVCQGKCSGLNFMVQYNYKYCSNCGRKLPPIS